MKQRLIVEGKDAVVLSGICKIRGLNPPIGYASEFKFRKEFVNEAGGYNEALKILKETLEQDSFSNVGIIVDADDKGAESRWNGIRAILSNIFSKEVLDRVSVEPSGILVKKENLPTVGIWIMPNNQDNGYLEHFLADMIPSDDMVWDFAQQKVDELMSTDHCRFTQTKKQKALLHTWLAWQKSPGLPFGTAVKSGYFDISSPSVEPFLKWFENTFLLA